MSIRVQKSSIKAKPLSFDENQPTNIVHDDYDDENYDFTMSGQESYDLPSPSHDLQPMSHDLQPTSHDSYPTSHDEKPAPPQGKIIDQSPIVESRTNASDQSRVTPNHAASHKPMVNNIMIVLL